MKCFGIFGFPLIFSFLCRTCYCWFSLYDQYVLYLLHSTSGYYRTVDKCKATGATFGRQIGAQELIGCVIRIQSDDSCTNFPLPPTQSGKCSRYIGLVPRGNCSFAMKVLQGQNSNYDAMVIYNSMDEPYIEEMHDDDEHNGRYVVIPSFMISYQCADLFSQYSYSDGYFVSIRAYFTDYDIVRYLVPFIAVVGFCFLAMLISMVMKLIRDRRRISRRRISTKFLKKIPTVKYQKNETPETCPICLDDFVEGEKLRLLPCKHWFHPKCIDPWLTKSRKVCPVCKRRVDQSDHTEIDSEDEYYNNNSERRPLISNNNSNAQSSSNANYSSINANNNNEHYNYANSADPLNYNASQSDHRLFDEI